VSPLKFANCAQKDLQGTAKADTIVNGSVSVTGAALGTPDASSGALPVIYSIFYTKISANTTIFFSFWGGAV
jgi:hypothetical protein